MNNRNQQTARAAAPAEATAPNYGAAFPHKERLGLSMELKALPVDAS